MTDGESQAPSGHRQLEGQFAALVVMDLAAKGCGFLATIALARHFSSAEFGAIVLAQSVTAYGLYASACGMDVHAVKSAVALRQRLGSVASTVMVLRLVLGSIAYAVLLGVAAVAEPLRAAFPLVALFGLTFFSGALLLLWVPQALQRTHVYGIAILVTQVVYLGLVAVGLASGADAWIAPVALLAGELLTAAGLIAWMRRWVEPLGAPLPPPQSLRFLAEAAPVGGSQVLRTVAVGSDLVVLGLMAPLGDVGHYAGANKLYLLCGSAIAIYFVVVFPHLARHAAVSAASVRRELVSLLARAVACALPGLALAAWLAPHLLSWLFDPPFATAAASLRVLLGVVAVDLVIGHVRNSVIALGQQRQDVRDVALSAMAHVVVKLALVPRLGMMGAALGTLAGQAVLLLLGILTLRRALRDA